MNLSLGTHSWRISCPILNPLISEKNCAQSKLDLCRSGRMRIILSDPNRNQDKDPNFGLGRICLTKNVIINKLVQTLIFWIQNTGKKNIIFREAFEYHFDGSGIFSTDSEPNLNLAHLPHASSLLPHPLFLIPHLLSLSPNSSSISHTPTATNVIMATKIIIRQISLKTNVIRQQTS